MTTHRVILFSCDHAEVLRMPHASRPYKLLRFMSGGVRMLQYMTRRALLHAAEVEPQHCECVKAWAKLRRLRKGQYRPT